MDVEASRNSVLKAAVRFVSGIFHVVTARRTRPAVALIGAPQPPLTVRVGVAGHLYIPETDELGIVVSQIFDAVSRAANELNSHHHSLLPGPLHSCVPAECRVVASLASGADQFAAEIASSESLHFQIEAILPFQRCLFEKDICKNCLTNDRVPKVERHNFARQSIQRFRKLSHSARVLELEARGNSHEAYANAAAAVLGHCDILLVIVDSRSVNSIPGSSLWLVRRALEDRIPVVRVFSDCCGTADNPFWVCLLNDGVEIPLNPTALPCAILNLLRHILLPPPDVKPLPDSGFLERRYRVRLDPAFNDRIWCDQWDPQLFNKPGEVLGLAPIYRQAVVWSDHRASGYAEMARGAVVFTAALGLFAVAGAVVGVLVPTMGVPGKVTELFCILFALLLIWRSHGHHWHDRWLGYRQIERRLLHAATLAVIGDSVRNVHVSDLLAMPSASRWPEWYVGAIQRYAGVPEISISRDWISAACKTIRERLIGGQIKYFESEVKECEETDEWLERWVLRSLGASVSVTLAFLLVHFLEPLVGTAALFGEMHFWLKNLATCAGALGPAAAGALAAVRGHGEYKQQALRYRSGAVLLKAVRDKLRPGSRDMDDLRKATRRSATILGDELYQWRNVHSEKKIDLS